MYYLTDVKPFLLEYSRDDEDLPLARIPKRAVDFNKVLSAESPSPPIIIAEHGKQPIPVDTSESPHSRWEHAVIWSVDDYCVTIDPWHAL